MKNSFCLITICCCSISCNICHHCFVVVSYSTLWYATLDFVTEKYFCIPRNVLSGVLLCTAYLWSMYVLISSRKSEKAVLSVWFVWKSLRLISFALDCDRCYTFPLKEMFCMLMFFVICFSAPVRSLLALVNGDLVSLCGDGKDDDLWIHFWEYWCKLLSAGAALWCL